MNTADSMNTGSSLILGDVGHGRSTLVSPPTGATILGEAPPPVLGENANPEVPAVRPKTPRTVLVLTPEQLEYFKRYSVMYHQFLDAQELEHMRRASAAAAAGAGAGTGAGTGEV